VRCESRTERRPVRWRVAERSSAAKSESVQARHATPDPAIDGALKDGVCRGVARDHRAANEEEEDELDGKNTTEGGRHDERPESAARAERICRCRFVLRGRTAAAPTSPPRPKTDSAPPKAELPRWNASRTRTGTNVMVGM
jgi:hypothetical protein